MSSRRRLFLIVALSLVVVSSLIALYTLRFSNRPTETDPVTTSNTAPAKQSEKVSFTKPIFDPALISHITPLGELNGGGSEWQATTGVMINIKPEVVSDDKMIDVFAPTAMTLEAYSYHKDPRSEGNADWALIFNIGSTVKIKFDHITKADDKIVAVTTSSPKDRSNEESPKTKIRFEAGERIAQTHGTKQAKNWNIYLTDSSVTNKFANQARYEQSSIGYRFINGTCPFHYYNPELKAKFIALMGATKAGQSADCGNPSNDIAGTLAGTWFFDEDTGKTDEQLTGHYASPLSVYQDSAQRVIIDLIANTQFRIDNGTNPANVTSEQCYKLTSQSGQAAGYAYFKLTTPTVMKLAYSATGACPAAFPETGSRTYYR